MLVDAEMEKRIREQLKGSVGEELGSKIDLHDEHGHIHGHLTLCDSFPIPQNGSGMASPVVLSFERIKSMCEEYINEVERMLVESKEVVKDAV